MTKLPSEKRALLNIGKINGWVESADSALNMRYSLAHLAFSSKDGADIVELLTSNGLPETKSRYVELFIKPRKINNDFLSTITSLHKTIFSQKESYEYRPGEWRSENSRKSLQDILDSLDETKTVFDRAVQLYRGVIKTEPFHGGNEPIANFVANLFLVDQGVLLVPVLLFSRMQDDVRDANQQVEEQTEQIINILHSIQKLEQDYLERTNGFVKQRKELFKGLLPYMMKKPKFTITDLQNSYQKKSTFQTINELFKDLIKLNVLKEVTGNDRHRVFHLHEYTQLFKPLV